MCGKCWGKMRRLLRTQSAATLASQTLDQPKGEALPTAVIRPAIQGGHSCDLFDLVEAKDRFSPTHNQSRSHAMKIRSGGRSRPQRV